MYVVRDGKLLVFRHPDFSWEEVGIQVPAGSIRAGETPESAALREAREETGLSEFNIVRKLGEADYDISPYRFEIQHRHFFALKLSEDAPDRWASQEDHDGRIRADAVRMLLDPARNRPCPAIGPGRAPRPVVRLREHLQPVANRTPNLVRSRVRSR
ncbi:NUDIX hydrolase [Nocardia gipuzkoensis]